jgi:hypothetical protein
LDPRELEDAIRFPLRAKVENHENLLVAVLPVVHAVDVEGNTEADTDLTKTTGYSLLPWETQI